MVAFYHRQAQELATITALVTQRTLLGSVRQTRTVWVRNRSHTFFDRIELPLDTVLAPNVQHKRDFGVGPQSSAMPFFSNTSNSLRHEFNPPSEAG